MITAVELEKRAGIPRRELSAVRDRLELGTDYMKTQRGRGWLYDEAAASRAWGEIRKEEGIAAPAKVVAEPEGVKVGGKAPSEKKGNAGDPGRPESAGVARVMRRYPNPTWVKCLFPDGSLGDVRVYDNRGMKVGFPLKMEFILDAKSSSKPRFYRGKCPHFRGAKV